MVDIYPMAFLMMRELVASSTAMDVRTLEAYCSMGAWREDECLGVAVLSGRPDKVRLRGMRLYVLVWAGNFQATRHNLTAKAASAARTLGATRLYIQQHAEWDDTHLRRLGWTMGDTKDHWVRWWAPWSKMGDDT